MRNKRNTLLKAFFMLLILTAFIPNGVSQNFPKVREDLSKRNFVSPAIEKVISKMQT